MRHSIRTALAVLGALACAQATAQTRPPRTASDEAFDRLVTRYAGDGTALIFQCKDARGEFEQETRHPERLIAIAREMVAGDPATVAKRSGCRRSNESGPNPAFSGMTLFSQVSRDDRALWLVGEVAESYPQSTGYVFEAIVRIPMAGRMPVGMTPSRSDAAPAGVTNPATSAKAAAADARFYEMRNTRTVRDTEESGYLICPTDAAIETAFDAAERFSASGRDTRTAALLKRAGCVEGEATVTGVRVSRLLEGLDVTWHAARGSVGGKRPPIVFWMY